MDKEEERPEDEIMRGDRTGFVYILENEGMPHLFKIGKTANSPYTRAHELSRETGVPSPFKVCRAYFVIDRHEAEKLIHKELEEYRFKNNREFFQYHHNLNGGWTIFQNIIDKILNENRLIDYRITPDETWQYELFEAEREIRNKLEKEASFLKESRDVMALVMKEHSIDCDLALKKAAKQIFKLKKIIEKIQNPNGKGNPSTLVPPAHTKPTMLALAQKIRRVADVEKDEAEKLRLESLADEMRIEAT